MTRHPPTPPLFPTPSFSRSTSSVGGPAPAFDARRYAWCALALVLTLGGREDAAIAVVGFSVWLALPRRRWGLRGSPAAPGRPHPPPALPRGAPFLPRRPPPPPPPPPPLRRF